jgi:hypothetical protein
MDGDERDYDPDRDAILSRRNRMIGIALAGLTSVAGCGDQEPEPQVCLSPILVEEQEPVEADETPEDPPAEPEVSPQPCLSVLAPGSDEPEPPPEKPGDHLG